MDSSMKTAAFVQVASISPGLDSPYSAMNSPGTDSSQDAKPVNQNADEHNPPYPKHCVKVLRFPVKQSSYHVGAIVLANTVALALIILCLHGASQEATMSQWEKRLFNFAIILLSAILSLGIGYLLDQLGLLARGQVLASNAHTELSIGYIIRGSMTSVAHLLRHHVFHRPQTFNRVTMIAAIYLVFSISARLSVAFLGLTFNVDESIRTTESVSISKWPLPNEQFTDVHLNLHNMTLDTLYDYAKFAVRFKTSDTEAKNTNLTADANEEVRQVIKKAFSAQGITQTLAPGQPIARYEYTLREFMGNTTYSSNRTVVVQTECHTYVVRNETLVPGYLKLRGVRGGEIVNYTSDIFNPKKYPLDGFAGERMFIPPKESPRSSCGPLCVRIWLWDKFLNTPGEATYQCENRIQFSGDPENLTEANIQPALAEYLIRFTADSEQELVARASAKSDDFRHRDVTDLEGFTNFANAIGLDEGYENGEIWVAAVLGRFTSVLILYLDEVLPKVTITESSGIVLSRLSVHWSRVAVLVGAMTGIQVILALGTIWYCMGSVLIPDETSPLGGLIGNLAIPRTSTFTSMISRSAFAKTEDSTVLARFQIRQKEDGIRRWILVFGALVPGEGLKVQRSSDQYGIEPKGAKGTAQREVVYERSEGTEVP